MRQRTSGFTLIEVMVAISLMGVGAMGLVSLLRHSAHGSRNARQMDIATQIAENWLERLKVDALEWNLPTDGGPLQLQTSDNTARNLATEAQLLASTQWLRQVSAHEGPTGPFQPIPIDDSVDVGSGAGIYSAFDQLGRDVPAGAGTHTFCASYRLSWVHWPRNIRADVRVWWPRAGRGVDQAQPPFSTCADANLTPAQLTDYHTVYLSTVIAATRVKH